MLPHTHVIHPSILYWVTPAIPIRTTNLDGTANLSPISSAWALADRAVLGMGLPVLGCQNLLRTDEAVIDIPDSSLQAAIESIADTTGCRDVPAYYFGTGSKLGQNFRAQA